MRGLAVVRRLAADRRGSVLVLVAVALIPLLGMVALAVDIGMLMTARAEAQRTADAAALSGAQSLIMMPEDEARAREWAAEYAALNAVRSVDITLRDEDIDVELPERRVRVRVYRTDDWGGAIPTLFARILGIESVGVSASAAAQVFPALSTACILPLALPDRWCEKQPLDVNSGPCPLGAWPDPEVPDRFGDDDEDWYKAWDPEGDNVNHTGYGKDDTGYRILIKPGNPQQAPHPGWFFAFRIPGSQGGADYRAAIRECRGDGVEWGEEMVVESEPGNMIGPTRQGFQDLIAKDPHAEWDDDCNCVVDSDFKQSPRIRPMVMFDPSEPPDPGMKPFRITNFVGIFVENIQGNDIWVRFVKYMGANPSATGTPVQGPLMESVRLVE